VTAVNFGSRIDRLATVERDVRKSLETPLKTKVKSGPEGIRNARNYSRTGAGEIGHVKLTPTFPDSFEGLRIQVSEWMSLEASDSGLRAAFLIDTRCWYFHPTHRCPLDFWIDHAGDEPRPVRRERKAKAEPANCRRRLRSDPTMSVLGDIASLEEAGLFVEALREPSVPDQSIGSPAGLPLAEAAAILA
jgi:hypothetical protein